MSELLSHRLRLLDAILAGSKNADLDAAPADLDAVALYLRSVPFDRIRQLSAMLAGNESQATDAETLAARLLLTDYRGAVANLRAATQAIATRVGTTSTTVKKAKRLVARQARRFNARSARAEARADRVPPAAEPFPR